MRGASKVPSAGYGRELGRGRGRVCLVAQQFCPVDGEAVLAGGEALPRRQGEPCCGGAVAQLPCSGGRAVQVRKDEGSPQLPAAPALAGESVVGQVLPTGSGATAPWG